MQQESEHNADAQPRSTAGESRGGSSPDQERINSLKPEESVESKRLALLKEQIARRRQVEEELRKESARVKLLLQVAITSNEARSTNEALQRALVQIAEHLEWPFGHVYIYSPDAEGRLVSADIWHCAEEERFSELIQLTKSTSFALGEGWLGQAAANGAPTWSADLSQDYRFIRHTEETEFPIKAGFALPIKLDSKIAAVMEFFSTDVSRQDDEFLNLMWNVGKQLSQVLERQQAQERLKRGELLLAQAERIAHLGSWGWDITASAVSWSDELYRIFGVDRQEFGGEYADFLALVHPEDRQRVNEMVQTSVEEGKPFQFHHRIVRPDGEVRILFGQGQPFVDEDGNVVRLFGTGQDVTDQIRLQKKIIRQSEQLQALQEMGHTVTSTFSREVIFQEVLAKLTDLMGAQGVFVLLLQGDELVFAASNQTGVNDPTGKRISADSGVAGEVVKLGKALALFGDEAGERTFSEFVRALGFKPGALLVAPLQLGGTIIGVLEAMHRDKDAFGEDDLQILESAASWTAIAIQNSGLFGQLRASRERLRLLAKQVVLAQESERRRISHELHDEAGQALIALKINLDMIKTNLPAEQVELREELSELVETVDMTMEQIRRLAHGLHPPVLERLGLEPAVDALCEDFTSKTNLEFETRVQSLPSIDDQIAITLYRVLQEALTNVLKHAEASKVKVTLANEDDSITLSIEDDGRGFVASEMTGMSDKGIGLLGMQERIQILGGSLSLDSTPGVGTQIKVQVPLYHKEGEES